MIPDALANSGVLALSDWPGRAFFFTTMRFAEPPATAFARFAPGIRPPVLQDYVMWGLVFPDDAAPSPAAREDRQRLHAHALVLAGDYHPLLRELVAAGDPDYTVLTGFAAAQRPTRWGRAHATLIGDALHVMPPFGAQGGNTALRGAAVLAEQLRLAAAAGAPLESAFEPYQREVLPFAFRAVARADRSMRQLHMARVPRWLLLRVLPRLHRRTVPEPS